MPETPHIAITEEGSPQPEMVQIKASAGSGKTYTLTRRFLAALGRFNPKTGLPKDRSTAGTEDDWRLANKCRLDMARAACSTDGPDSDWTGLMAITFTNAAAAEMQERVILTLKQIALEEIEPEPGFPSKEEAADWVDRILHNRSSLNISTIDSLLNLILRMSALSMNLPPDFSPVFNVRDVMQDYWQNFSNRAWQGSEMEKELINEVSSTIVHNEKRNGFSASGGISDSLMDVMRMLIAGTLDDLTPPEFFVTEDGRGCLPELRKRVCKDIITLLKANNTTPDGATSRLVYDGRKIGGFPGALDDMMASLGRPRPDGQTAVEWADKCLNNASDADWAKLKLDKSRRPTFKKAAFVKTALSELKKTNSCPVPDNLSKVYLRLKDEVSDMLCFDLMYRHSLIYGSLRKLATELYTLYKDRMPTEGQVFNDAIPGMVSQLLDPANGGVSDSLCRLGTRISHFLVDEFQDTSRTQWAALRPLVIEALARAGSFCWVGDVKQAIYGFRGGDSQLFDEVAADHELVTMLNGTPSFESLDKNWRSAKEIIDFNNKVFSPLGYPPLSLKISEDERKELETQAENRCEAALASILTKDDSIPFLCSDLAELPDAREGENLTRYMARRMARAYQGTAQEYGDKAPDGGRAVLLTFPKKAEPETEADANEEGEGETVFESDPQIRAIGRIILSRVSAKIEAIRQKKSNAQKDEKHIQDTIVTRDEIPWSDFMVLVRTNNQATKVARHMAALGIPVITENSLMLVEHPLVIQTVALLSFLRAPDDDAAFWTLISGSLLGLEVPSSAGEAESAAGTSSSETSTVAPAPETAPSAEQTVPAASACSEDEADRLPAGAYSEDEDEEEGFPCSECTLESVPYTPAQQVSVCRTESNASTDAPERPNQEESATDSGAGEPTDGEAAQEAGGGDASELSAMEREARRVNAWDLELALLSRTRRWNKDGTRESLSACWSRKYKDLWDTSVAPLLSGGASMAPYDLVSEWYDHVDAYRRFRDGEPFLRRMLEILHTSALHGLRSLDDFLDYWNEHGEDEKLPMPEGLKAVSIMTMHKSKGLQRDTVIVPWTTTTERGSAKLQVVDYVPKNGGEPVHALCKPDYFFPRQRINKLADALEAMNRYYVAFTRAKSELYVFLSEKPEGSGKMLQQLIDNAGTSIPKKIPWADSDFASVPEVLPPEAQLDAVPQAEEAGSTAEASSPERSASAAAPDAQLNANSPAEEAGKSDPEASSPEQDGSAAAPEAQLDADSPAEGQSGPQQLWEPTLWMPSMRLHFDFMDESNPRDAAREQGIFIHGCLEALARVPAEARSSESDFSACLERVLTDHGRRAPWLMEMEGFRDEARDEISWFAALERRFGWLDNALPEQGLIDGQGYNKRMDLMVMGPKRILVLDYKTGRAEEAYQAEHHAQVRGYLQCVRDAGRRDRPAPLGIVVYLKDRRLHIVLPDGSSWKNGQRVSGKDAVSLLLDETEFAQALNELENREDAG